MLQIKFYFNYTSCGLAKIHILHKIEKNMNLIMINKTIQQNDNFQIFEQFSTLTFLKKGPCRFTFRWGYFRAWWKQVPMVPFKLRVKARKNDFSAGADKSETAWISTVLKSGTLTDKMSAYVVLVQSSPIHNLPILQQLVNYVSLKSRRPCLMAIGTYLPMVFSSGIHNFLGLILLVVFR